MEVEPAAKAVAAAGRCRGYRGPELLHLTITFRVPRSFTEQPEGSNSTEQLLLEVNWWTDIRFLISFGETRTLLRCRGPDKCAVPVEVTGSKEPSPTTIAEGKGYRWGKICERERESETMWEVAPESKYHSVCCGWFSVMVLKVDARDC